MALVSSRRLEPKRGRNCIFLHIPQTKVHHEGLEVFKLSFIVAFVASCGGRLLKPGLPEASPNVTKVRSPREIEVRTFGIGRTAPAAQNRRLQIANRSSSLYVYCMLLVCSLLLKTCQKNLRIQMFGRL